MGLNTLLFPRKSVPAAILCVPGVPVPETWYRSVISHVSAVIALIVDVGSEVSVVSVVSSEFWSFKSVVALRISLKWPSISPVHLRLAFI